MYSNYQVTILRQLKQSELMILTDFNKTCQKYDLDWFAIGGTAIGCARHQGFIPWDDDIDIGMLREDYDRFVQIWKKELGDKYHLATPETEPYYSSAVVKLMRKGTKFIPPYAVKTKADMGIHIDIFVYDNYTNDSRSKKQIRMARFWDQMLFLRAFGNPEIPGDGMKSQVLCGACHAIHGLLSLFHISPVWMYRKFTANATKYNSEETEYVTIFQDPRIHDSRLKKSEIFPIRMMPFEQTEIPMMNDYMAALIRYFGDDVMKLPPEEKRVNHAPVVVDFGDMFE